MGILTKERVSPSSKRMLLELLDKHGKYEDCFFSLNTFRVKLWNVPQWKGAGSQNVCNCHAGEDLHQPHRRVQDIRNFTLCKTDLYNRPEQERHTSACDDPEVSSLVCTFTGWQLSHDHEGKLAQRLVLSPRAGRQQIWSMKRNFKGCRIFRMKRSYATFMICSKIPCTCKSWVQTLSTFVPT